MLYLAGLPLASLVAGLATAPYAAFHFNRFAVYGLFANLLAVPLTSFLVMPAAVLAAALMPLGLADPGLWLMGQGVAGILAIAHAFTALPGAAWLVAAQPTGLLVLLTVAGLWLCLWRRIWRHLGWLGIAAALLLAALPGRPPDLLVDGQGRLMAGRAADGRLLLPAGAEKGLLTQTWLRRFGQAEAVADASVLACDRLGCVCRRDGRSVLLVRQRRAALEDCGGFDLLLGASWPPRCQRAGTAISGDDMRRAGAVAIWFTADGYRIESAREHRGERPWVLAADRQPRPSRRSVAAQQGD
ncbi:MAG: ComEC/Rec2 family competence protein [Alphaproteobacteria bacterium]|nr:ComEC/Rec2 family competence protein [Alphaproteobacteria bacterium]